MANFLSIAKQELLFQLLCEGNGVNSCARIIRCSKNTVALFQRRMYGRIKEFNSNYIKNIESKGIEVDELKTYVQGRWQTNIKKESGYYWIYVAIDRHTKLIIDFHVGKRTTKDAKIFFKKISARLNAKCNFFCDGLKSYISAIRETPDDKKWEEKIYIDLVRARSFGITLGRGITNRIESHNGVLRQHVSRLKRKTRCISKKKERLIEHLTLFFFYYNFIKKHKSLGTVPAVQAKVIKEKYSIQKLVA